MPETYDTGRDPLNNALDRLRSVVLKASDRAVGARG